MRKLLSANLSRLWKSRLFWMLNGICFSIGVFIYSLVVYNTHNLGQEWLLYSSHLYFFLQILYVGIIIAVFTSLFIGTEYSDGTVRNKIVVGHSRQEIYTAFLLTSILASFCFTLAHQLALVVVGIPFAGIGVIAGVHAPVWRLGCCMLIIIAYAAMFTMISLMDSHKARTAVVSILLALLIILGGMMLHGALSEPQFDSHMVMQTDGTFVLEEGLLNPRYIGGNLRVIFEWITAVIPAGAAMMSLDKNALFDWRIPVCLIGLISVLTVSGLTIFKKKDIK